MRRPITACTVAVAALLMVGCGEGGPTSPADDLLPQFSKGKATHDLGQRSASGWTCVPIPALGVHCFPPGAFVSDPSITVQVFATEDPADTDAPFLGTEVLIRADLYAGQPCPAQGGEYDLLPASETPFPVDYRACHHYTPE